MTIRVRAERELAAIRASEGAWQALAERALVANPFYEPWFLLPALEHLDDVKNACVLFVEDGAALLAVCPLSLGTLQVAQGGRTIVTWARLLGHRYSMEHTPLLAPERAHEAWAAILDHLAGQHAPVLALQHLRADSAFADVVRDVGAARGLPSFVRHTHERALLLPDTDADAYLEKAFSPKRRKDLRRNERALRLAGTLELPELRRGDGADPGPFIEQFVALEASGWKGRAGTAFGSSNADRAFFAEVVRGGALHDRIWIESATLDGTAVAMLCNLVVGDGSFSWKIAYDERYARHSPGLFIEVVNLRRFHERDDLAWMDSGAIANHPLIDRLWVDRRRIEDRWLATGGRTGRAFVQLLPFAHRVVKSARRLVRRGRSLAGRTAA